jgi:hypothetical protein
VNKESIETLGALMVGRIAAHALDKNPKRPHKAPADPFHHPVTLLTATTANAYCDGR